MGSCPPPSSTHWVWGQDEHIWLSLAAPHFGPRAGMKGRINGNRCDSSLPLERSSSFPVHLLPPQPLHSPHIHMAVQVTGAFFHQSMSLYWTKMTP